LEAEATLPKKYLFNSASVTSFSASCSLTALPFTLTSSVGPVATVARYIPFLIAKT
jgi:hypothetical protein